MRKLLITGAMFCALQAYGQVQQQMTPQIKQYLVAYYDAVERSDPQKAIQALTLLITADPNYPNYYGARASVLESLPDIPIDSILQDLDRAVTLDSTNTQWLAHRADLRLRIGTDQMRMAAYNDMWMVIKNDSTDLHSRIQYLAFARINDTLRAAQIFREAESLAFQKTVAQPDQAENWYQLALVYTTYPERIDGEMLIKILGALNTATQLDPDNVTYYTLRADVYAKYMSANSQLAISDYQYVLGLSPSRKVYIKLAQAQLAAGLQSDAKATLQQGLLLHPGNYVMRRLLKSST